MKRLILLFIFSVFIISGYSAHQQSAIEEKGFIGVDENEQYELKIYPNPTRTGQITLEMNSREISEILLIDISGKTVISRKVDFGAHKYLLKLEDVPDGIYFVRVKTTANNIVVKKLIVSAR
ncbi:T9SS type A sorting domain-containing protein [Mariniphaga sediminis]|uniref:T9SS type A sorting domain-containing protein n=1 Tax=Mariniphaga sediminis TaxID=1628158 RepID=UPI0035694F2D